MRRNLMGSILAVAMISLACGRGETTATDEMLSEQSAELRSDTLVVPGNNFYPESIAVAPNSALYVSSITTGEILKYPPLSSTSQQLVAPGVNIGTAGIVVDALRHVLWACAVDLSFATPTSLRAFDLDTGALKASYTVPDGGVCGDVTMARGSPYFTDTLLGKIFRVKFAVGNNALDPTSGTLELWSADPLLKGAGFLQVNGIDFDGLNTFYTTNYSTGTLVKVKFDGTATGTAAPASEVNIGTPFTNPDGIRMLSGNILLVTENNGKLTKVNVNTGARAVVSSTLDQPTSVVVYGNDAWVSLGQVLRLQQSQPPNLPFAIQRVRL